MKRKMAMASLSADHSGSSKRVCTETGLNPPQLLSQAPGKGGSGAPAESLSVLADNTFLRQEAAEEWARAALGWLKPLVARAQQS